MPPGVIKTKGGSIQMNGNGIIMSDCGCCPADCPGLCYCCCPTLRIIVSGFTGDCAVLNGTFYFELVASPGEACNYTLVDSLMPDSGQISCSNDAFNGKWIISFYMGGELILQGETRMERPATNSCFPFGASFTVTAVATTYQPTPLLAHFDEYSDDTVLLLHCEGSDASTTFTDSSKYNAGASVTNAEIDTAQYKVGASSGLLVGTGNVAFGDSTEWALGTGNFCFEGWIRLNSLPAASEVVYLINKGGTAANGITLGVARTSGGALQLDCNINTTNYQRAFSFSTGVWYHLCVNREGSSSGNVLLFVDGTQQGAAISDNSNITNAVDVYIGDGNPTGLDGWVDEIRVSSISRFTSNFTPQTTPYFLEVIDSSSNNQAINLYGDAEIDTGVSKFGAGSLRFHTQGIGYVPSNGWFDIGTGNFTVELWFRMDSLPTSIVNSRLLTHSSIVIEAIETGFYVNPSGRFITYSFSTATWYHVALVRFNGVMYFFVDGAEEDIWAYSSSIGAASFTLGSLSIGIPPTAYSSGLDGWIDEFRFSRIPRYIEAFTPSASAFTLDDLECDTETGTATSACMESGWYCVEKLTFDDICSTCCQPLYWNIVITGITGGCCEVYENSTSGMECSVGWQIDYADFPLGVSLKIPFLDCVGVDARWLLNIPNAINVREYVYPIGIEGNCEEEYFSREFTLDADIYITGKDGVPGCGSYTIRVLTSSADVTCNGGGATIYGTALDVDVAGDLYSVLTSDVDVYPFCASYGGYGSKYGEGGSAIITPGGCE